MGLSNRLKERREQLGLTQSEVASLLGITPGAIGNYENGVSTPKADILFKVFDALKCDANYLFQDEMKNISGDDVATPQEMENIVKKYRDLDDHGKKMVDFTLKEEWERSTSKLKEGQLGFSFDSDHSFNIIKNGKPVPYDSTKHTTNAANAIPDASKEDQAHDNDIMNSDDF